MPKIKKLPPPEPRKRGRPAGSKNTKPKAPPEPKLPKVDADGAPILYKCTCCGKVFQNPVNKLYMVVNSECFNGNDHYSNVCNVCANRLFDDYKQRFQNEKFALLLICGMVNAYFSEPLYESLVNNKDASFTLGYYFRALNGLQYKGKSFTTYLLELKNQDKTFKPKEELVEIMEARWTTADRRNKNYCLQAIGYDPFDDDSYNDEDRKFLYNTMASYLSDEVLEDAHKVNCIIAMVKTQLQIQEMNTLMNRQIKSISPDYAMIKSMSDTKNHLQQNVNTTARDNGISAIGSGKKQKSTNSLTTIMKEMIENNYDDAKANVTSAKLTEAYKEVAAINARALINELNFTSDEYAKMVADQSELVASQSNEIIALQEQNRLLKREIHAWEQDAKLRKAKRIDIIEEDGLVSENGGEPR